MDDLPSFDDLPEEDCIPRLHRVKRRRREDCSIMGGGKSVMPVQHSKSIRERYHRYPVALADVPEELSNRVKEVLNKDFRVE